MTEDEQNRLGREAQHILQSDAFKLALERLDATLVEAWASGTFSTPEQREEAFSRVRGARLFKQELTALLNGWKVNKARDEERDRREKSRPLAS